MRLGFLLILFFLSSLSFAQDTGSVKWIMDDKTELLLKKKTELDQQKPSIQGYRVQLYYGGNRNEAMELKAKFASIYSSEESYLIYQQPYFRLRVGNFRTKTEAHRLLKKVQKDFPSAFIVNDEIGFPK